MTSIEKIKINKTVPTTLIYKGGNSLGKEVATNLIEQGGFVIVIDDMSEENVSNFKDHLDSNLFLYLDFVGLDELRNELERLDYIIFIDDIEKDVSEKIGTDFFLKSSNDLNKVLKISLHFKSKFVLASSLKVHQVLVNMQASENQVNRNNLEYNRAELQRYSESLVKEFVDKASLDARIVRVGELLGEGTPLNIPSEVVRLVKLATSGKKLNLIGDGLQSNYLISLKDAGFGLLKSLFEEKTKGKIYSICYPQEITSLSIAYKLSELEEKAGQIVFDDESTTLLPISFENSSNLSDIGWSPKITLERALSQEIDWVNKFYGRKGNTDTKKDFEENEPMKISKKSPIANKEVKNTLTNDVKLNFKNDETHSFINKLSEVTKSKSRNSKIVLSDKLLREKLKEKEIKEHKEFDRTTFSYKFNYWIRTLTMGKVFTYFLIFILSFVLYFLILSPLVRSIKNVYTIYKVGNNVSASVGESDLKVLSGASSSLVTDLTNAKVLFDVFRLNDLHSNLTNNFNIVKEYSGNALQVIDKFGSVKNYFASKDIDNTLSESEYSELKKLSISNDKLMLDSKKISPSKIGEIDSSVKNISEKVENEYFKPSDLYISFEESTTLFNIYEENLGYLILYSTKDTNNKHTVNGYSYFNNQDFETDTLLSGKFEDTFKLSADQKVLLDALINKDDLTKVDRKEKSTTLIEYFNTTLTHKVDSVFVIDYDYNPILLGDSNIQVNNVELDSEEALNKILTPTDLNEKINISSKVTQNYFNRSVDFTKLTDYLNLFLSGVEKDSINLFTTRGI